MRDYSNLKKHTQHYEEGVCTFEKHFSSKCMHKMRGFTTGSFASRWKWPLYGHFDIAALFGLRFRLTNKSHNLKE